MKINWSRLKKNIPHQVKVRGKTYEVLYVESFPDGMTHGETRFQTRQIVLLKTLTPKQIVSTFFHEILHLYSYKYDANLTENQVLALEKSMVPLFTLIKELYS